VPTAAEPMPQNNGERALNTAGQVLGVVLKVAGWLLLIAVVFFAALMALRRLEEEEPLLAERGVVAARLHDRRDEVQSSMSFSSSVIGRWLR
jgi:hypothetical protein